MIPASQGGISKKSKRRFKVAAPAASEPWLCHGRDWAMLLTLPPSRGVESNPIHPVTTAAKDRGKGPLTPQVRQPQVTATASGPGRLPGSQERNRQGSTSEKKMKGSLVSSGRSCPTAISITLLPKQGSACVYTHSKSYHVWECMCACTHTHNHSLRIAATFIKYL